MILKKQSVHKTVGLFVGLAAFDFGVINVPWILLLPKSIKLDGVQDVQKK